MVTVIRSADGIAAIRTRLEDPAICSHRYPEHPTIEFSARAAGRRLPFEDVEEVTSRVLYEVEPPGRN
jgi:hypothetical protein